MTKSFTISAPARIHFGLFSIAEEAGLRFGGAGAMVRNPSCSIAVQANPQFSIRNDVDQLLAKNANLWFESNKDLLPKYNHLEELPLALELISQPHRHSGFGSGTQTAMTVATALFQAFGFATPGAESLATMMKRGKRSAIGTHGFLHGGFLVDQGLTTESNFSKLDLRIDFPQDWRFVLVVPRIDPGMHGTLENKTFEELVEENHQNRSRLVQLCTDSIVPAIAESDYAALGAPLFEFNRISGKYFSRYQFGCYHSELCAQIVDDLRQIGISAVGQSSWGPCIFSIAQSDDHANETVAQLRRHHTSLYDNSNLEIIVSEPDNRGVRLG